MLIGSSHSISKKIGVTDHQCRTYIKYGLKNNLIFKTSNGYQLSKYKDLILNISVINEKAVKYYKFNKVGNFQEIENNILFQIAKQNFNNQLFYIKRRKDLRFYEALIKTEKRVTKKQYNFYTKNKMCLSKNNIDSIVTGQKHLAKILGVSTKLANELLKHWHELKLIIRNVIYKPFQTYLDNIPLRMDIGLMKCYGSRVTLL